MKKRKKIEKPWCIYGWAETALIGKIVSETSRKVSIKCSEGRATPPKIKKIEKTEIIFRFVSLGEAINEISRIWGTPYPIAKKIVRMQFPDE
ncbi:MAG: hypothetical protein GXP44_00535 [bacterium]|nr:hypothetical protein [bacterium]